MRYDGLKAIICASLLSAALLTGGASGFDLGLTVAQDVLFQPFTDTAAEYSDSLIRPVSAQLGVGFSLGGPVRLQVRAGYSGYLGFLSGLGLRGEQTESHGVRLCAVPFIRVAVPAVPLFACAGVGVGGHYAYEVMYTGKYGWHELVTDRGVAAVDQTFTLGIGFDISRRFALDFEVERPGFRASYEYRRRYLHYTGFEEPVVLLRDDVVHVGWRDDARTGVGATLRLKL